MIHIHSKKGVWFKSIGYEFLVMAQIVFGEYSKQNVVPVVTSACDGDHMDNSYHYRGLAWDWRIWDLDNLQDVVEAIKTKAQESDYHYDVVLEEDHLHTEFDEQKTKPK